MTAPIASVAHRATEMLPANLGNRVLGGLRGLYCLPNHWCLTLQHTSAVSGYLGLLEWMAFLYNDFGAKRSHARQTASTGGPSDLEALLGSGSGPGHIG